MNIMSNFLPFRQVHLDFHTSEAIKNIGRSFDSNEWTRTLKAANVDSITLFAKCHHGWSYHPTEVGTMHPNLSFNLLDAQFRACKAADINAPVYISAGLDNVIARTNPQWREIDVHGCYAGWVAAPVEPGFHTLCFNTPYLDYLCRQIEEVVTLFPDADGIFLDIVSQSHCCCPWCMEFMERNGWDAQNPDDRQKCARAVLENYLARATGAARVLNPAMAVFHNTDRVVRGERKLHKYFSHLEIESLPTGGWGYDHFTVSAKYAAKLPFDFLGMTGKFHTSWGEFGGFKHPDALKYECSAMLALNAKCSVGDQLHPEAKLDPSTYTLIGDAYAEVAEKEPWCENAQPVADVALLSSQAMQTAEHNSNDADTGAARILMQSHFLFDVIDDEIDFSRYKCIVLPDDIAVDQTLKEKLDGFVGNGGALLLSGKSGLSQQQQHFLFDAGVEYKGESEFCPDYILPAECVRPYFITSPFVMYRSSQRIAVQDGVSLGKVVDPYFNRTFRHFCSHRHAPNRPDPSKYDAGAVKDSVMYLAHPVFTIYREYGAAAYLHYVRNCLNLLLKDGKRLETNLPSQAQVMLNHQPHKNRYVLHLLYAPRQLRSDTIEVIDDIPRLHDIDITLRLPERVTGVFLQPQNQKLEASEAGNGAVMLHIDRFRCHQMIELVY